MGSHGLSVASGLEAPSQDELDSSARFAYRPEFLGLVQSLPPAQQSDPVLPLFELLRYWEQANLSASVALQALELLGFGDEGDASYKQLARMSGPPLVNVRELGAKMEQELLQNPCVDRAVWLAALATFRLDLMHARCTSRPPLHSALR